MAQGRGSTQELGMCGWSVWLLGLETCSGLVGAGAGKHAGRLVGCVSDGKGRITIVTYVVTQGLLGVVLGCAYVLGHAYLLRTCGSMCVIAFIHAGVNMELRIAMSEGGLMGQVRGVASATCTKILKIPVVVTKM